MVDFSEFIKTNEEEWRSEVLRSLKLEHFNDYDSPDINGIEIDPFIVRHDKPFKGRLVSPDGKWKSGVIFNNVSEYPLIIPYLENGAEAINVELDTGTELSTVYNKINAGFIYNDLELSNYDEHTSKYLSEIFEVGAADVRGSLNCNTTEIKFVKALHQKFPKFHLYTAQNNMVNSIESLSDICNQLQYFITSCVASKINLSSIRISVNSGQHLLESISKIRACRMLWANLLAKNGLDFIPTFIVVNVNHNETDEIGTQLIESTLAIFNSVLGTADIVFTPCRKEEDIGRLMLNIQQISKLEAHMDRVKDPLAGSYQIEHFTSKIAKQAWNLCHQSY